MKCWFCNPELIWANDFDFEDYGLEGEGVISVLACTNEDCDAIWEGYVSNK